jgi:Fur family ferric uptake transcriptional regulator
VAKAPQVSVDVGVLKKRIRDAGLRGTGSRIAVLRILQDARAPMTHSEVSERLTSSGYDHATIYRNLIDLSRVGLLARSDIGDHAWRFELRRGSADHKAQHPHFVCVDCGDVNCLPEKAVSVRGAPGVPRALRRRGVVIQLQGRCDSCERLAVAG